MTAVNEHNSISPSMSDHFAALVETQLLRRRQGNAASMPARSLQLADAGTKAPPPAEVDRQEGETSDLLSGCLMLGPHGVVYSSGDGDGISETDTAAVRAVAEAALQLHPTGQPKSLYLRGLRYTVTRCERSHVLAVSRDEVLLIARAPINPCHDCRSCRILVH